MNMPLDQDLEDAVNLALSAVSDLAHEDQVKALSVCLAAITAADGNNHSIAFCTSGYVYKVDITRTEAKHEEDHEEIID
jgi:hypothetical protein